MPETIRCRIEIDGIEQFENAGANLPAALLPFKERLIGMGWTAAMAEAFCGDIAEAIAREIAIVKVG